MDEAIAAMDIIPKKVKAEKQARLQAIREEKKAKADATAETEKAEMAVATVKREADEKEQKRIEKITKLEKTKSDLAKKAAKLEMDANRKKWEEEKKNAEAALERTKKIAAHTIKSYIKERREKKRLADDDRKQMKEGEKLEGEVRRGIRLSKRDQEKLEAFQAIKKVRGALPNMQAAVDKAQAQLDAANKSAETLAGIRKDLQKNQETLEQLLKMG